MHDTVETPAEYRGSIRKLCAPEQRLVEAHLLRLDTDARHRRFGHDVSNGYIHNYVAGVVAPGNLAFGYFLDGSLRALAELKRPITGMTATAEAAFSVEREFANRGIATMMMGSVIRSARNRGVKHLLLYCMADNAKMQAIARRYAALLRFEDGAIIADIVPAGPDYSSLAQEFVEDRLGFANAMIDYQRRLLRAS